MDISGSWLCFPPQLTLAALYHTKNIGLEELINPPLRHGPWKGYDPTPLPRLDQPDAVWSHREWQHLAHRGVLSRVSPAIQRPRFRLVAPVIGGLAVERVVLVSGS
jgi:hypothetical protein